MKARDGRLFQPVLTALREDDGGRIRLLAPTVGLWRGGPGPGELIGPGEDIGELEILGALHRLVAPPDAAGAVVDLGPRRAAPIAVQYRTVLLELDPDATQVATAMTAASDDSTDGLVFRAPLSGRFYARPAPDKPPFVQAGDTVTTGQTVALLEVMKTFNRVVYGGDGLPPTAKVKRVVVAHEADLDQGDPILELE